MADLAIALGSFECQRRRDAAVSRDLMPASLPQPSSPSGGRQGSCLLNPIPFEFSKSGVGQSDEHIAAG